jgi:hypothetical protein
VDPLTDKAVYMKVGGSTYGQGCVHEVCVGPLTDKAVYMKVCGSTYGQGCVHEGVWIHVRTRLCI